MKRRSSELRRYGARGLRGKAVREEKTRQEILRSYGGDKRIRKEGGMGGYLVRQEGKEV